MSIFTMPVVLGDGKKLFADGSAPHSFKLTRSRVSPNGLIVGHYEREGEIKTGSAPQLDSPSEREIARRERMKREGKAAHATAQSGGVSRTTPTQPLLPTYGGRK